MFVRQGQVVSRLCDYCERPTQQTADTVLTMGDRKTQRIAWRCNLCGKIVGRRLHKNAA